MKQTSPETSEFVLVSSLGWIIPWLDHLGVGSSLGCPGLVALSCYHLRITRANSSLLKPARLWPVGLVALCLDTLFGCSGNFRMQVSMNWGVL